MSILLELDLHNRRRATRLSQAVRVTTMDRDFRRGLSVALQRQLDRRPAGAEQHLPRVLPA